MPEITKHVPGMFSWADLGTTDVAAAKQFYTGLFGWTYRDDPMGPDSFYSRAFLGDKDVCALFKQQPEQAKLGIPPHWDSYITVESADAAAAAASAAGGKVLAPPFDVFDAGRMTVLQDPTGAVIAAWQPKQHLGARLMNEAGTLCWTELMTGDTDAAGTFYGRVFGWTPDLMPMPTGAYTVFKAGGQSACGMMAFPPGMPPMPPCWTVYFAVKSCDESAGKASSTGGKVLNPPTDIPGVGRFAVLQDPQGVVFAILEPKM